MRRIEQIMAHPVYQKNQKQIEEAEADRVFCKHGLDHALDVARILYIMVLEQGLAYEKDVIYAAALLHDIGRYEQYTTHIPHHDAGAVIAEQILEACYFSRQEIILITKAIKVHQGTAGQREDSLDYLLWRADKLSRNCYCCQAQRKCYWETDERNQTILY